MRRTKKPWPTKDVMDQIYENKLWGGSEFDFYSGQGSHSLEIVSPYIGTLKLFFKSFQEKLIVCDLGCGDFNIGKELVECTSKYIAVDIVESLIKRNKEMFKRESLEFHCLDITVDSLPKGDCAILRQVLQHLSNAEVNQVLIKLKDFKYVILTEHIPVEKFEPNKDIISGQGIRLKEQSGVDVLEEPFNFEVKSKKELLVTNLENGKGVIATTLYTVF